MKMSNTDTSIQHGHGTKCMNGHKLDKKKGIEILRLESKK